MKSPRRKINGSDTTISDESRDTLETNYEIEDIAETEDDWIRTHWRPLMAYAYMSIVIFDFIIGPVIWSTFQLFGGSIAIQWNPLTLISGGIFHAAMGAVLGISAFTRGQEKVEHIRRRHSRRSGHDEYESRDDLL